MITQELRNPASSSSFHLPQMQLNLAALYFQITDHARCEIVSSEQRFHPRCRCCCQVHRNSSDLKISTHFLLRGSLSWIVCDVGIPFLDLYDFTASKAPRPRRWYFGGETHHNCEGCCGQATRAPAHCWGCALVGALLHPSGSRAGTFIL